MRRCLASLWARPKYGIVAFRGEDGPRWRIVSLVNGEILAVSEAYSSPAKRDQTAAALSKDTGWPIESKS